MSFGVYGISGFRSLGYLAFIDYGLGSWAFVVLVFKVFTVWGLSGLCFSVFIVYGFSCAESVGFMDYGF